MQSYLPPEGIHSVDLMNNVPFELHFNGIRLRIVRVSRVCDNTIPWIIPYHAHEKFEFHYVSGGKGYIDIENSGFEVVKGDFFITAPYVRHRQSSHSTSIMEEFAQISSRRPMASSLLSSTAMYAVCTPSAFRRIFTPLMTEAGFSSSSR